ncbi:uncharacterized protein M421DRAFT_72495 [Didymella exigua CBS 183.55]|uniref:ZN622/Rei1/Reh1 zinc finger C2H2-type domain-containing protein n=1 Tax=Didymella exigua CBS 183.55 TaxID=1150837 RepID=A0A6A5RCX1_9PLEO|nr:uncharacterized protein M421DRAFT_72495 [Didymella exigua CBS 183.55]KAF1924436.1 hypothetical protein M421DRAFT_72495 [Didymella exigua CBS 183.55]
MTATATALTATTATTTNNAPQPPTSNARLSWGCHNCSLFFDSGEMQRAHMKSPWHIYNLKRRISSLSPITLEVYENKIQTPIEPPQAAREHNVVKAINDQSPSPNQCLFCHLRFDDNGADEVGEIVEHMAFAHGLFIPDQDLLSSQASFLGYLATQIRVWHECLYCETSRTSTTAIQSHMRDSGHCMLNFEKEPELCEFWERRSGGGAHPTSPGTKLTRRGGQELHLLSGKTVGSKSFRRPKIPATGATNVCLALPVGPESSGHHDPSRHQTCHQLSRRDEMGIQNISFQQRHGLVVAVKRSQNQEAMARRAKEWTSARKANDQKHDQNYGALAWAKGGMHNLLPR